MDSLVSQSDFASHLRLLGAFSSFLTTLLKDHLVVINGVLAPTLEGDVFLRRSVHRLKLWIIHILRPKFFSPKSDQALQSSELPPLDVILMLHAYMLHPRAFYEDTIRTHPELAILKGFPLTQVAALVDESMDYVASNEQVGLWESVTGEAFAPLQTTPSNGCNLTCPACRHSFTTIWTEESSDGFAADISIRCDQCELLISDEILGVASIMNDIRGAISGDGAGLAGTLLTTEGVFDAERSKAIASKIAKAINFQDINQLPLQEVTQLLKNHAKSTLKNIGEQFLDHYGYLGGFSLDIASAAVRQLRFAGIMYDAGWTDPRFPLEAPTTIRESISRYGGFLKLTMRPDEKPMAPTLEIDLVWHTHQLSSTYRSDCMRLFGWFLDHVDVVTSNAIRSASSNAYDRWQKEFGTPYHDYFPAMEFKVET